MAWLTSTPNGCFISGQQYSIQPYLRFIFGLRLVDAFRDLFGFRR